MKSTIYKTSLFFAIVTIVFASCFMLPSAKNKPEKSITYSSLVSVPDSQFQIGAFHNGLYLQYEKIKDLGFNTWHFYTSLLQGWNYDKSDNAYSSPLLYKSLVDDRFQINSNAGLRTYFDRPIVEYVIAGQRVDYQCENVPDTSFYSFYRFNYIAAGRINNIKEINDTSPFGKYEDESFARVVQCTKSDIPYYIDSNLYANRNLSYNVAANPWCNADAYDWFIMPRIRIDNSFAMMQENKETEVCRIMLYGWNGELVRETSVKVKNFINPETGLYDGSFLEDYFFLDGETNLNISKELIKKHFSPNPAYMAMNWDAPCQVDIRVLWSGKCNMWIDRIRLENEPARRYMTLKENDLIEKVNAEADRSILNYNPSYPVPNYFYFEECTLNHFPAIKALNKQIMSRTNNRNSLIIWLNNYQINAQIPYFWKNLMTASKIYKLVAEECGIPAMVVGWYGLEGWSKQEQLERISYHPNTFTMEGFDAGKGIISYPEIPWKYDSWLQNRFDSDLSASFNLIQVYRIMDSLSRKGMRIISCPQAHSFFMPGGPLKEPTNEEIEVQTCLAISYNTKGVMYFSYNSFGEFSAKSDWSSGIINTDGSTRTNSVYGQNKFEKIKELNSKLNKWGPYVMQFIPIETRSCIVRNKNERSDFFKNTYFEDVVSYKPFRNETCPSDNPGGVSPQNLNFECLSERYIQAASFKTSDGSKFFMILNRRCSPYINNANEDNAGGRRYMRIKLDANSPDFTGHNKWKIVDLETGNAILTFNKSNSEFLELGWFLPGEGKLFRILPAID